MEGDPLFYLQLMMVEAATGGSDNIIHLRRWRHLMLVAMAVRRQPPTEPQCMQGWAHI
jgi:hypothetical protein